jgi:hypothetical protein
MGAAEQQDGLVVVPAPRPSKGLASWALDLLESVAVRLGHDRAKPLHWLSGNFAPVVDETPPAPDLPVRGHLPVRTSIFRRLLGRAILYKNRIFSFPLNHEFRFWTSSKMGVTHRPYSR